MTTAIINLARRWPLLCRAGAWVDIALGIGALCANQFGLGVALLMKGCLWLTVLKLTR
jgi:hypothetical protein